MTAMLRPTSQPQRPFGWSFRSWLRRWLRVPDAGPLVEFSIGKLELKPGDVLVINADRMLSADVCNQIKEHLRAVLAGDVRSIVLDPGMHFEVIRRPLNPGDLLVVKCGREVLATVPIDAAVAEKGVEFEVISVPAPQFPSKDS